MSDIDLTHVGDSYTFSTGVNTGAIFAKAAPGGAGTGNYDPFLTVQDDPTEQGYNTDQTKQLDNVDGGDRTSSLLLSSIPVKIINGIEYYQFSVDLNEPNSDPILSIERLELYTSSAAATSATFQGTSAADAFDLAHGGFKKVFDLDVEGSTDNRLILSDSSSSGSGTDDYVFLVPVANFGNVDPTTTYLTMYTDFGQTSEPNDTGATFEEWRTEKAGTVDGVKFLDLDGDGVRDSGEVGMGGVTVFIDDNHNGALDPGERSTITAADGSFHFYGVVGDANGEVWIDEQVPDGYRQTTGDHEVATVVIGDSVSVEIGNQPLTGSISGAKKEDTNNDNTGDAVVAGWGVQLYRDNGDGLFNAATDTLVASTTTDASGAYSFSDVIVGNYFVVEETRTGWQPVTGSLAVVADTVAAGDADTVNFVNERLGSISGTKMEDTNNDNTGDANVSGWGVQLYRDNGDGLFNAATDTLVGSTTTNASGAYSFTGLENGNYFVVEETRTGWQPVTGQTAVRADTISPGDADTVNFVNERLGSISGMKFGDVNGDGVHQASEVGLVGWTIKLYNDANDNGVLDTNESLVATTVTGAGGAYSFDNLEFGHYLVVEEARNGWMQTAPNSLDSDTQSGDVDGHVAGMAEFGYAIDLAAGATDGDNDFGNFMVPGPGVRTPGFWASKNGLTFWDDKVGVAKSGPNFASGDLNDYNHDGIIESNELYLYLGDWNKDGDQDPGETILALGLDTAKLLINANDKDVQDGRFQLARDAVATWLNYLAGNGISDGDPTTFDPKDVLEDAIRFLDVTTDGNNNNILETAEIKVSKPPSALYQPAVSISSDLWQQPLAPNELSASYMHSLLDEYNNHGAMTIGLLGQGTIQYAFDAD